MSDRKQLVSPWELCRDIASWLPQTDQARAVRIIEAHEREHARVERAEMVEGAD